MIIDHPRDFPNPNMSRLFYQSRAKLTNLELNTICIFLLQYPFASKQFYIPVTREYSSLNISLYFMEELEKSAILIFLRTFLKEIFFLSSELLKIC